MPVPPILQPIDQTLMVISRGKYSHRRCRVSVLLYIQGCRFYCTYRVSVILYIQSCTIVHTWFMFQFTNGVSVLLCIQVFRFIVHTQGFCFIVHTRFLFYYIYRVTVLLYIQGFYCTYGVSVLLYIANYQQMQALLSHRPLLSSSLTNHNVPSHTILLFYSAILNFKG